MGDNWEIMWCYVGWFEVADRLEAMLPPWATLRRMETSLPLAEQVSRSDVLIPTTGTVDGAVIRAATRCKLIAQPAAGTDCIALDVAKQLGIPVTNAPGKCRARKGTTTSRGTCIIGLSILVLMASPVSCTSQVPTVRAWPRLL